MSSLYKGRHPFSCHIRKPYLGRRWHNDDRFQHSADNGRARAWHIHLRTLDIHEHTRYKFLLQIGCCAALPGLRIRKCPRTPGPAGYILPSLLHPALVNTHYNNGCRLPCILSTLGYILHTSYYRPPLLYY